MSLSSQSLSLVLTT